MNHVIAKKLGRAGLISLNRPEAMNALNLEMIRAIDAALDEFQADDGVFCVVLTSNTERAFSSGGDMRRIRELVLAGQFDDAELFFNEEYALIEKIACFPKPFISLIDGICMGGGMGISVHGAYRVATERAVFAMPETAIGLIPDVGGTYFLPRMPECCGTWLGLTGASVRGFDAHGLGISTHMAPTESLPGLLNALCYSSDSLDKIFDEYCAALGYQPEVLMLSDTTHCFSQPTLCSIVESLEKHLSKHKEAALEALKKASPRSLLETLTLLRNGAEMTLSECLEQEFEAVCRAIRHPDLTEGVRAVLVDKDHSPQWVTQTNQTGRQRPAPQFMTEVKI